jgi:hypothetical protein
MSVWLQGLTPGKARPISWKTELESQKITVKDNMEYHIQFVLFTGVYYKGDIPCSVWYMQNVPTQITSDQNTLSTVLNTTAIISCTAFIISKLFRKLISRHFQCATKFSSNFMHTSPNLTVNLAYVQPALYVF